eukprot:TRINITY_DN981_c0_g1_i2.p1 TRINITY_DN981_c0_g1~~TRINITY_DN981_c0_g1_i2.p1  ORF type:complete len:207 (-),score=54.44 TRINITY_DN981_c0_g1_i2:156-776(-)
MLDIYMSKLCPFAHRAAIVLAHHNIEHNMVEMQLGGEKPEWFLKINPKGTVPSMVDGETTITESDEISFYLDEKYGEKKLMTDDLEAIKASAGKVGCMLGKSFGVLKNKDYTEAAKALEECMANIEAGFNTTFVHGDSFSMADVLTIPFFIRMCPVLKHYRDIDILAGKPKLSAWYEMCKEIEAVKATTIADELYYEGFKKFVDTV